MYTVNTSNNDIRKQINYTKYDIMKKTNRCLFYYYYYTVDKYNIFRWET